MKEKILIVEDDHELGASICESLENEGYDPALYSDPAKALQAGRQGSFPLLITDLKLPGIDGLQVARELRNNNPDIRVLIMTAYSSMPTVLEAMRMGVDTYILKPFSYDELLFQVNKAFEAYNLVKENRRYQENLAKMIEERTSELVRREQELQLSQMENIFAIGNIIEARDPYTRGHTERVTLYAVSLARAAGLSEDRIYNLGLGSPLHDVGKIGIADKILKKDGPLTFAEYEKMKDHPNIGYELVRGANLPEGSVACILYHHERFDGKGYPFGLKGKDIPEEGRIMSVCDAFDAMTSNRIYRKAMAIEKALDIIGKNAGTQFDPEYAGLIIELVEHGLDGEPFVKEDITEDFNELVVQLTRV